MSYTKVIATGHVIEVYHMEKEPVNPHDYIKAEDDNWNALEGIKHDGTISAEYIAEGRKKVMEELAQKKKEREDRKEERRAQTLRDARNRCRRYALANFNTDDVFMTLTYADNFHDVKQADKDFKQFIKDFRKYTGVKLKYLAVREFQKRGAIHYHFVTDWKHPSRHVHDKEYIRKLERIVGQIWGKGFVDIAPLNRSRSKKKQYKDKPVDNIGAYLTKYMSKETDDSRLQGHKVYLNSQGLEKPLEYTGEEAEAIIKAYQLDIKKETFTNAYESEYLGKITYKEYNLKRME